MHILVIEDEPRLARAIKKGLEQEGWHVEVCERGDDGYEFAREEAFKVIILDRMLPGMDGVTIAQKLREAQITTPILMLTAKIQTQDKVTGLDAGADDYLTKPFAFEELVARVRALARRQPVLKTTVVTVGDVELDTSLMTAVRRGHPLQLSQKEFALLEYLMRHSPQIFSKQHLIEHVWEYDADILPNTVEAVIGNLRRKLQAVPGKNTSLIKTVRGFGYKIEG